MNCFIKHVAIEHIVCVEWNGQSGWLWFSRSLSTFIRWRRWIRRLVVIFHLKHLKLAVFFKYFYLKFYTFVFVFLLNLASIHSTNQNLTGQVGTQLYASPEQASIFWRKVMLKRRDKERWPSCRLAKSILWEKKFIHWILNSAIRIFFIGGWYKLLFSSGYIFTGNNLFWTVSCFSHTNGKT